MYFNEHWKVAKYSNVYTNCPARKWREGITIQLFRSEISLSPAFLLSADAQTQLATAQEKERASTERSIELSSRVASLESQVGNYRQEKSRIEAEFELEKAKLEALEDYKCR